MSQLHITPFFYCCTHKYVIYWCPPLLTPLNPVSSFSLLVARGMHSRWAALNRCHCELETDGNEGSPQSGSPAAVQCTRCQGVMTAQQGAPGEIEDSTISVSPTHPSPHSHTHTHTYSHGLCKGAKRRGVSSSTSLQECESGDLSEETSDRQL